MARRHRLAPNHRARDVAEAARSIVCLHATDPATVYLSARARVDRMAVADMERALYADRSLVKHLAMRRTLFAFPREAFPLAQAGASERVADLERRRLIRDVEKAGLRRDGARWLSRAQKVVLEALADGREASSSELREEISLLQGAITYGEGRSWGGQFPVAPRVLTTLSAAGKIVRGSNAGAWNVSRPLWATTESWLGEEIQPRSPSEGAAWLVAEWLRAFGPGTEADLKWWLGSTLATVRRALADVGAVEVRLGERTGYLLADDIEPEEPVEPWAALLPSLDPTAMGWFERDWYLGPHKLDVFDRSGNAGATAWWDGWIVGGWRQAESGDVVVQLLEDIGAEGRAALDAEAERLTAWLDGARVSARFPAPLAKRS